MFLNRSAPHAGSMALWPRRNSPNHLSTIWRSGNIIVVSAEAFAATTSVGTPHAPQCAPKVLREHTGCSASWQGKAAALMLTLVDAGRWSKTTCNISLVLDLAPCRLSFRAITEPETVSRHKRNTSSRSATRNARYLATRARVRRISGNTATGVVVGFKRPRTHDK